MEIYQPASYRGTPIAGNPPLFIRAEHKIHPESKTRQEFAIENPPDLFEGCVIIYIYIYISTHKHINSYIYTYSCISSSTAQGGGGSFKNRKPIGEIGCCESGMTERIH